MLMLAIGLIIGLLAGAMLARGKKVVIEASAAPRKTGNCPYCKEKVRAATLCDSCGSLLVRCPHCAESNRSEAAACRCCGAALVHQLAGRV
jgi:hypothetical protein